MGKFETSDDQRAGSRAGRYRLVYVEGLELLASVGVFEVEKRYEQRILVSVKMTVIDEYDGLSDRLDDVLDYGAIIDASRRIVDGQHYNLIETVAERIADAGLADERVRRIEVRIDKPDIIPGCRAVGIAIVRDQRTTPLSP